MPALREALTENGFGDVQTYVQSGNVVLSAAQSPDGVAERVKDVIATTFGLDIDVIVRTREELARVVERNPLKDIAVEPKRYQVSFLSAELEPAVLERLSKLAAAEERLVAIGRELYAWHPAGVARSKLWAGLAGQRLGVTATARNWTTVTQLLAISSAL
jgi:uncharacterized protein (DUF1697 family)